MNSMIEEELDVSDLSPFQLQALEEEKKNRVLAIATDHAIKSTVVAGMLSSIGTLAAIKYSPSFAKYTSISARTSIPIMISLAVFSIQYELTMYDAQRNTSKYGTTLYDIKNNVISYMPIHHRVCNYMYDHPYQLIFAVGSPLVASILYSQMHEQHLKLSQRIMHTRVYGQAGVLAIALSVMGFRKYMDERGRFPEPSGKV